MGGADSQGGDGVGRGAAEESPRTERAATGLPEEAEMIQGWGHSDSSWRVARTRAIQARWVLGAFLLLGALLLEVWQQSAVASLSVRSGRAADLLKRASNELEWSRAELDRGATRAEV